MRHNTSKYQNMKMKGQDELLIMTIGSARRRWSFKLRDKMVQWRGSFLDDD